MSAKKQTIKRACIDCHFLVSILLFDCKLPTDIGVSDFNHYIYSNMLTISRELEFDNRELIQFRSGFSNTSLLGCWNKCWVDMIDARQSRGFFSVMITYQIKGIFNVFRKCLN